MKGHRSRVLSMVAAAILAAGFQTGCENGGSTPPEGPGSIVFTSVPGIGSTDNLQGTVSDVSPSDHMVAVYIYVGGWWTKPSFAKPLTPIRSDGRWSCDITTGGNDASATKIAAYVVPVGYTPPQMSGGGSLPSELGQNAVAQTQVAR